MRSQRERLLDMLEAIDAIERYAVRGRAAFDADELIRVWFMHHLQIIGEAARALPDTLRAAAPSVPWPKMIGMRHILVHGYFHTDEEIVWDVVSGDLSALKAAVARLLDTIPDSQAEL